ncbi:hypothetical protein [Caballeronia novacaledonica]|uniref:hypothetical protein n=1 Tax=Caballeronia novacaledonica TaxID=1544861 RepID=UPI001EE241BC|nr:hypothetical protein [Caballeronia novacaledonica]
MTARAARARSIGEKEMSYLTIIAAVWGICAVCAVLFIRGAAQRNPEPLRVQRDHEPVRHASKDFGRSV